MATYIIRKEGLDHYPGEWVVDTAPTLQAAMTKALNYSESLGRLEIIPPNPNEPIVGTYVAIDGVWVPTKAAPSSQRNSRGVRDRDLARIVRGLR